MFGKGAWNDGEPPHEAGRVGSHGQEMVVYFYRVIWAPRVSWRRLRFLGVAVYSLRGPEWPIWHTWLLVSVLCAWSDRASLRKSAAAFLALTFSPDSLAREPDIQFSQQRLSAPGLLFHLYGCPCPFSACLLWYWLSGEFEPAIPGSPGNITIKIIFIVAVCWTVRDFMSAEWLYNVLCPIITREIQ